MQAQIYDETTVMPAHDEMHTKVPSSIVCHRHSAQRDFTQAKITK